jgi:hypothetical protein
MATNAPTLRIMPGATKGPERGDPIGEQQTQLRSNGRWSRSARPALGAPMNIVHKWDICRALLGTMVRAAFGRINRRFVIFEGSEWEPKSCRER